MKSGDATGQQYWKNQYNEQRKFLSFLEANSSKLGLEETARLKLKQITDDYIMTLRKLDQTEGKTRSDIAEKQKAAELQKQNEQIAKQNAELEKQASVFGQIAEMSKTAQKSMAAANKEAEKENKQFNASKLKEAQAEYRRLTQALREYLTAYKNGDTDSMQYWEQEASKAHQALTAINENTDSAKLNAETKEKIARLASDAAAAEDKHRAALQKTVDKRHDQSAEAKEAERQTKQMVDQIERWLATMVLMRGLQSMWREAITYATNYYDAMNEIRIVTMQTEEESLA